MNICSFDIVEETQRNEPWVGSSEQVKLHLDAIFSGGNYTLPQNPSKYLSYSRNPLSNRNNKFIEQIGEIKPQTLMKKTVLSQLQEIKQLQKE